MQPVVESVEASERSRSLLLSSSPDKAAASRYLASFQQAHPDAIRHLASTQNGLQCLIAVFSYSRFLSDELLQHPEWIEEVASSSDMHRVRSTEEFRLRLEAFLESTGRLAEAVDFAIFRRRELLRILLRDVMGSAKLAEITEEISNLADAILDVSYRRIRAEMVLRHGVPRYADERGQLCEAEFSILALGKLGGRELNYSSDVDLMFFYSGNGETDGKNSLSNKEFFKKVANLYTGLLSTYTPEGVCYRVDLRLRPDGSLGEVCLSLEGARAYYSKRARDWELQMLIKARVAAGEPGPGRQLLESVQSSIYSTTLDFAAVEAVSATRIRIHEKLAKKRGSPGIDVKLARGGIRDVEFLVQCLQRLHGGRDPWVRHGGTLHALQRLHDKDLLSDSEYSRLACAYEFFRHVEHRLQMLEDRQTHVLDLDKSQLDLLAKKMPLRELGRAASADKLLHQLNVHLEEVQSTYDRIIHSVHRLYYDAPGQGAEQRTVDYDDVLLEPAVSNLIWSLRERAPGLAKSLAARPLRIALKSFEVFLERIYSNPTYLNLLDSNPTLAEDVLELFENSPHFAEQLTRNPEMVADLTEIRAAKSTSHGSLASSISNASELRRFFHREMLGIQAASICCGLPIFDTLGETSDLADAAIQCAYRLARDLTLDTNPPADGSYKPANQLMVIALGRLGLREFDLGSDADLNFVLPDQDSPELRFWTRVAERMIDILTAYTGDGSLFTVDTRLRPNGREGNLVQTVSAYKDYIEHRAEAWEGITYMKSRAVAGDTAIATRFLHELQEADWRRYGQSGRSRADLRSMRARLEREQGSANPLKAGPGGYYDIDFALMYLRLRSAGIFFKVLNTPERIDIIANMGHMDRTDAEFLHEAAAFYRAIDHGLRVYSGHAEGKLPNSEMHLSTLARLVRRWTSERLQDAPLPQKLVQIQAGTRDYFKRLFG